MTKKQKYKILDSHIIRYRRILFLQGWEVFTALEEKPLQTNPDLIASMEPSWRYRTGYLRVYPKFWTLPPDLQQQVILHEMVHIVTERPFALLQGAQSGKFVSDEEYRDALEHTTT